MTTVIVDLKRKQLGADTQCTMMGTITRTRKIVTLDDGTLVGCAGDVNAITQFIESLRTGIAFEMEEDESYVALVCKPDNRVFTYMDGKGPIEINASTKFFAIGSGAHYAMGAMQSGKTIDKALQYAAELDPYTSGPFDIVSYGKKK